MIIKYYITWHDVFVTGIFLRGEEGEESRNSVSGHVEENSDFFFLKP